MKKSNPQSAFPVLFLAALIMAFGGGQLEFCPIIPV